MTTEFVNKVIFISSIVFSFGLGFFVGMCLESYKLKKEKITFF